MSPLKATSILAAFALAIACNQAATTPEADTGTVLARVNGTAITQEDVDALLARGQHGAAEAAQASPAARQGALENLVRQELIGQKAEASGIDKDPELQVKLVHLEKQYRTMRRDVLAEAYFKKEVEAKAQISDADLELYIQSHEGQLKNEFYINQLMYKNDELALQAAKAEMAGGATFEAVATKRFSHLPESAGKPWALNALRWSQLPPSWKPIIEKMKPGEISDIVRGPGGRAWILQLVDVRPAPDTDPAVVRSTLRESMMIERMEAARTEAIDALRQAAKIEYLGEAAQSVAH